MASLPIITAEEPVTERHGELHIMVQESRYDVGLSLTWPVWRHPTKGVEGFHQQLYFFPFVHFFPGASSVEFHSRWEKVSFVEIFGVAAYPIVTSGLTWERDNKSTWTPEKAKWAACVL